jgi:hypothetical protein
MDWAVVLAAYTAGTATQPTWIAVAVAAFVLGVGRIDARLVLLALAAVFVFRSLQFADAAAAAGMKAAVQMAPIAGLAAAIVVASAWGLGVGIQRIIHAGKVRTQTDQSSTPAQAPPEP